MDQVVELLSALSSPDQAKRKPAEELFQQGKNQPNPDQLVLSFLQVLGAAQVDVALRTQAAVLLRQLVSKTDKAFAFARCSPENKTNIAGELLRLFPIEQNSNIRSKIGEVISRLADAACSEDDNRGWFKGQRGWPEALIQTLQMASAQQNANPESCTAALELVRQLVIPMKEHVVEAQANLSQVIEQGLTCGNVKVKSATFQLVCEMVSVMEKKNWAPLVVTVPLLNGILVQLAQANEQDELQECLQGYVEVAEVEPDFFKQSLSATLEPAKTLGEFVRNKEVPESLRNMALEWLVSYTEKKPKWLAKSLPAFAPLAIEGCMHMMLEVDSTDEDLKAWAERMDDEEGEEDADEVFHSGEEAIDRIVEAMDMDNVSSCLFPLVARFAQQSEWQAKLAALAAIKQTVEYADEEHIAEMSSLLLAHVDHAHPRVRYTALHAIGQLANDQAPHFQEKHHKTVMPVLLTKMDDTVDRVASMAMSAFVSFGEELDTSLMLQYSNVFMEKLVSKLKTSNHRMVKEESITSIAVIAGVIEKEFSAYYDAIMPILKQLVMCATGEKESRLRGKAFECMSLLGIAVGKEKFLPDAQEAVQEMLKTPNEADDLQREYIKEASERICKCLKQDFAFFLPHLLPGIFKNLKLEEDTGTKDDDADNFITVSTGEGKLVKVHSSKFEELLNSVQLLTTFCSEMEASFFEFVQPTAQALLPLLTATDEVTMLCDEARSAAFQCWALLIKCARKAAEAAPQSNAKQVAQELLGTFLPTVCKSLAEDKQADTIREGADGLAECIKNGGQGCIEEGQLKQIAELMFTLIQASLKRTDEGAEQKKKDAVGAPAELQADEDDENNGEDDEESCRRSLEEVLGALMEVSPDLFTRDLLGPCIQAMKVWFTQKNNATLALFLACDILQHLKERSTPQWEVMMPAIFSAMTQEDADLRIPAAYAINLASSIPAFAQAAPEAVNKLRAILTAPTPKKRREEKAKIALDNAVAAMLALAVHQPEKCDADNFTLVLNKLPLKDDEEEAKKVHKLLVQQCAAENQRLFGANASNLPKILSVLAEMYKQESICEKETDEMIVKMFKGLPPAVLQTHASSFSEKQQKKVERIITAA